LRSVDIIPEARPRGTTHSANANLIIWPTVFEAHRRIISATVFGCRGSVWNANGFIHLIAEHVERLIEP
jgi:hypothetical protein